MLVRLIISLLLTGAITYASERIAGDDQARRALRDLSEIEHIIIIYQENWSFDTLFGQFPGANGYAKSFNVLPQFDVKADPPYSALIDQTPSPLRNSKPDSNFPSINGKLAPDHTLPLPLMPYDLRQYISAETVTGDLVHTFYHQQLQIDNGALEPKNGDNPGLVLSFIDTTNLPEGLREDGWGVGTRVPTILVSPFVERRRIDSTEYETVSILKLIERRFNLLPFSARDQDPKINNFTRALGIID